VHWVVSEHGAACLKGKCTAERARALIGLADPKFRDHLTAEAQRLRYLARSAT
jgi:itaconate CoA-transferase